MHKSDPWTSDTPLTQAAWFRLNMHMWYGCVWLSMCVYISAIVRTVKPTSSVECKTSSVPHSLFVYNLCTHTSHSHTDKAAGYMYENHDRTTTNYKCLYTTCTLFVCCLSLSLSFYACILSTVYCERTSSACEKWENELSELCLTERFFFFGALCTTLLFSQTLCSNENRFSQFSAFWYATYGRRFARYAFQIARLHFFYVSYLNLIFRSFCLLSNFECGSFWIFWNKIRFRFDRRHDKIIRSKFELFISSYFWQFSTSVSVKYAIF